MRLLYLILILLVIVCFLLFICNNSYEELLNYDPDTLIPDKISNSNVKRYKEKPYWPVPNLDYLEYCISNPYNKDCKRPKTKKLALGDPCFVSPFLLMMLKFTFPEIATNADSPTSSSKGP